MKTLILVIFAILFASCGKEEFATIKATSSSAIELSEKKIITGGFDLSPIKPKVDFLFVWDNSGSQNYVSTATKLALASTVAKISSEFDYRILLAPLIPLAGKSLGDASSGVVFSPKSSDTPTKYYNQWRPLDSVAETISLMLPKGSGISELGINRSIALLDTAAKDKIFRTQSHVIILLVSNGDDTGACYTDSSGNEHCDFNYSWQINYLKQISGLGLSSTSHPLSYTLDSKQIRFFSLVPFKSACQTAARAGYSYIKFSNEVYRDIPTSGGALKSGGPDSYDFCYRNHFENLFSGINNSIRMETPYTYKYWPVYLTNNDQEYIPYNLDKDYAGRYKDFRVYRVDGNNPSYKTEISHSSSNGWTWSGVQANSNPSLPPEEIKDIWDCTPFHESSLGECSKLERPLKGYFIALNGNAKINYPDFIRIETSKAPDYYGYVKLNVKPIIHPNNMPVVFLNGVKIPTSGWEYLGQRTDFNLKILPTKEICSGRELLPPGEIPATYCEDKDRKDIQSGYIIQLKPEYVYSNGDHIQVKFDPSGR